MTTGEVVLAVIFAITALAAIYYAYQAKAQVEKTKEIILLEERDFEPNVFAEVNNPEIALKTWRNGTVVETENVPILALCPISGIAIPIKYANLSRGISEFLMTVSPWIEKADGKTISLCPGVTQGLFNGKARHIMISNEIRATNFAIDLEAPGIDQEVLGTLSGYPGIADGVSVLVKNRVWSIHIQIFIDYLNERVRVIPRYYDHYYSGPGVRVEGSYVIGFWIFEGRSETPYLVA
ncbi:MAG TPA: hypothetical protein VMX79_00240 [bacterium]|nr:hypothetical protein [bacterium]